MPRMVVKAGKNAGAEYRLEGEKFTIGRRKACDIPIADLRSSRNQAEIFRQGEHYYVRDLASSNGTFLNGERLTGDARLSFGDRVIIGDTILEFTGDSAGKPISFEIPGYEILERIGEGGMGVVYRARQISMDRVVAIKVLSERYSANTEFIERFIREARAAGRLNHPNVIHVHDVSRAGGCYFFSMEYIDGPTVKSLLRQQKKLPVKQSVEIVTQAAKALEFAHENGIIHRDVKPDNIMLTGEGVVKLADLGIAKGFEDASVGPEPAGQRRVLGTPHYMAPEQAMGKAIDRRADIYSLGATFFHMLTGKTPFTGSTVTELLKAHVHDKLEPIQYLNPEVPEAVCFVVERMMAKSPEKRYDSMTRVIEDLRRAADDKGADIERLPPEESSIMAAAEVQQQAAERAERMAHDRAARRTGNLIVMAVLLLLTLGVAVGAFIVVTVVRQAQNQQGSGGQGTGPKQQTPPPDDGGTTGPAADAAGLLREAEELLASGANDEAEAKAKALLAAFADRPEAKRAVDIIGLVKTRRDNALQAEINLAVAAAEAEAAKSPDDYGKQIAAWQRILSEERFRGTDAEAEANRRIEAIRAKRDQENAGRRRTEHEVAVRRSEALREQKDFLEAAKALREFSGFHAGSEEAAAADARAKEIDDAAAAVLAAAEERSAKALASDAFGEAAKAFDDLRRSVKSAAWMEGLQAKTDELNAKIGQLYAADRAKIDELVQAGKQREAEQAARMLGRRFRETAHAAAAAALAEGLAALPALRQKVLDAIAAQPAPREVTFKLEAALFPGVAWKVASANADKINLSGRHSGIDLESPLNWSTLSARDTYNFYLLYIPTPGKEEHRMLAFFCESRGLAQEAEEHRQKAQE